MGKLSGFLFPRPSFLEGAARVVDVGGTLNRYNRSETPEEADALAMYADWKAVGEDIRRAMQRYRKRLKLAGADLRRLEGGGRGSVQRETAEK